MAPAARCAHGILVGISEFNADTGTLPIMSHRVGFGLTEEIPVASNLVIYGPAAIVSDWSGHMLNP